MKVLITSKTKFGKNHACVGGMVLENNKFIRLLNRGGARNPTGWYQFRDTPLNIGDIWDIDFRESQYATAPHIEDVFVQINKKITVVDDLENFIKESGVKIWEGHIEKLFDGKLAWLGSGSGYLPEKQDAFPDQSVGFWISDEDLVLNNSRYFYNYKILGIMSAKKSLKWVGLDEPLDVIPKGTLIRVSLAKWWPPEGKREGFNIPYGCYLQLSGWY